VDTFVRPLNDVDRAIADGEGEGFVKIHVRKGTIRSSGHNRRRHAGEMINEITLAIVARSGWNTVERDPPLSDQAKPSNRQPMLTTAPG